MKSSSAMPTGRFRRCRSHPICVQCKRDSARTQSYSTTAVLPPSQRRTRMHPRCDKIRVYPPPMPSPRISFPVTRRGTSPWPRCTKRFHVWDVVGGRKRMHTRGNDRIRCLHIPRCNVSISDHRGRALDYAPGATSSRTSPCISPPPPPPPPSIPFPIADVDDVVINRPHHGSL
jgi:hypothetical protein